MFYYWLTGLNCTRNLIEIQLTQVLLREVSEVVVGIVILSKDNTGKDSPGKVMFEHRPEGNEAGGHEEGQHWQGKRRGVSGQRACLTFYV